MRLAVLAVFALALGAAPMAQPMPSAPAAAECHVPAPNSSYSLSTTTICPSATFSFLAAKGRALRPHPRRRLTEAE
jgi:hypothetical protein